MTDKHESQQEQNAPDQPKPVYITKVQPAEVDNQGNRDEPALLPDVIHQQGRGDSAATGSSGFPDHREREDASGRKSGSDSDGDFEPVPQSRGTGPEPE